MMSERQNSLDIFFSSMLNKSLNEYSFIKGLCIPNGGLGRGVHNQARRPGSVEEDKRKFYKQFARVSAIGLEMGLSVAIGLGIGYLLDRLFGTKPWLMVIFFLLGVIAAFRSLLSLAKEIDKSERKK